MAAPRILRFHDNAGNSNFKVKVRTFKKYYYFNIKIIIVSESRDLGGGGDTLRSDFKSFGAAQALKFPPERRGF